MVTRKICFKIAKHYNYNLILFRKFLAVIKTIHIIIVQFCQIELQRFVESQLRNVVKKGFAHNCLWLSSKQKAFQLKLFTFQELRFHISNGNIKILSFLKVTTSERSAVFSALIKYSKQKLLVCHKYRGKALYLKNLLSIFAKCESSFRQQKRGRCLELALTKAERKAEITRSSVFTYVLLDCIGKNMLYWLVNTNIETETKIIETAL